MPAALSAALPAVLCCAVLHLLLSGHTDVEAQEAGGEGLAVAGSKCSVTCACIGIDSD